MNPLERGQDGGPFSTDKEHAFAASNASRYPRNESPDSLRDMVGRLFLWLMLSPVELAGASASDDPLQIIDGTVVDECAWPSVVALHDEEENEACTGVYIGGRVVLTAAHCMASGFTVETFEDCTTSGCPSLGVYDNAVTLQCDGGGLSCSATESDVSNAIRYAKFGEHYRGYTEGHIRKAVKIAYCREFDTSASPSSQNDFAYCILMEDPQVQPVPIMMHCEADQYLGAGTEVWGVGFGREDAGVPASGGVKRVASATTTTGSTSGSTTKQVTSALWTPGAPTHGDSGGPGFVQLPDDTWRVWGIAVNAGVTYVTVWPKVEWMLDDPNVDEDAIIPCHTPTGAWCPKMSGCGGYPRSPDVASGDWARGPLSCESTDLGGASATCSGSCIRYDPKPETEWSSTPDSSEADSSSDFGSGTTSGADGGSPGVGAPEGTTSCMVAPTRTRSGTTATLLLLMLASGVSCRRRSTR